ncbi:MAG: NUDIX domain-containing protein [Patescibacteria group bacterium]
MANKYLFYFGKGLNKIINFCKYFAWIIRKKSLPGSLVILYKKSRKDTKFLLVKQKGGNRITFPSGFMTPGESFYETAIKEVYEETGYKLERLKTTRIAHSFTHPKMPFQPKITQKIFLGDLSINHLDSKQVLVTSNILRPMWRNKEEVTKLLTYPELISAFKKILPIIKEYPAESKEP